MLRPWCEQIVLRSLPAFCIPKIASSRSFKIQKIVVKSSRFKLSVFQIVANGKSSFKVVFPVLVLFQQVRIRGEVAVLSARILRFDVVNDVLLGEPIKVFYQVWSRALGELILLHNVSVLVRALDTDGQLELGQLLLSGLLAHVVDDHDRADDLRVLLGVEGQGEVQHLDHVLLFCLPYRVVQRDKQKGHAYQN